VALSPEDHIAIQQLYARYSLACDLHDWDGWLEAWTYDGVFVNPDGSTAEGHDALRAQAIANSPNPVYHWNGNLVIEPTAEGAKGTSYLLYVVVSDGPGEIRYAMYYEDELVKGEEGWRFRRRHVRSVPGQPHWRPQTQVG
jgi:hypothetical protein